MTDGPTGIPVAPESMEDATMAKLFRRAAQAIVDASEYPNIVKDLQGQVEALRSELDRKSTHASQLDQSLAEVRQERDSLRTDNNYLKGELEVAGRTQEMNVRSIHELEAKLQSTEQALDHAKTERDDYGMKLLHAEEQVADWKDKATKARDRLNDILGMFKEPEPEAKAEPAVNPSSSTGSVNEASSTLESLPDAGPSPAPVQEPTTEPEKPWWEKDKAADPTPTPTEPDPYEYTDTWEPGSGWAYNPNTGKYKRRKDGLPF